MLRLALTAALLALLPTTAHAATLEAESFSHDASARITTPRTASNGQALAFTANGTATLTANVPATSRVRVRARGGMFCGEWPHIVVSIAGQSVINTFVSQYGWGAYTGAVNLPAGSHVFALTFDNADFVDCLRVLRVDVVSTEDAPLGPWRAFADSSVWNQPAGASQPNPWPGEFTSYDPGLLLGGGPAGSSSHDHYYAKPQFYCQAGNPTTTNVNFTTDWSPTRDLAWDRGPICIPPGAQCAPGSDGHLTIISADRRKSWEFWRCTSVSSSGITTAVIAQFDLLGNGYSAFQGENSARGSGLPLVTTTLTPEDALNGVNHALGLTVPNVNGYIFPATKSDGNSGSLKYGQRFVLRPDFPETGSVGRVNVIRGLKVYGAYLVDQGASFEIDTVGDYTATDFGRWVQAGITRTALNDIRPADLRYSP